MKKISYINKIGFENIFHARIIKKKSKDIEISLPDDPAGMVRTITRKSVETIEEIEKEEPLKTK